MGFELSMSELPLALFSSIAPMGAGAFLILAISCFTGTPDAEIAKKADKLTVIPIVITAVGFICAFFHLANPFNALNVFNNVGSSPMSNEILIGCIFMVVAIVCWGVLICAKPSEGLRKALLSITAIVGLIFCAFIGLAYGMETIQTWDIPVVPLSTLCFGILGGSAVGFAVLKQAGVDIPKALSSATSVIAIIGAIGSVVFFGVQMGLVAGMSNNMMLGSDLVSQLMPFIIIAVILMIVATALLVYAIITSKSVIPLWVITVIMLAGILIARLCFYGVEMSVGLGI